MPMDVVSGLRSRGFRIAAAAIAVLWLTAAATAVDSDKVLFLGGTVNDFPPSGPRLSPPRTFDGRFNLTSEAELLFEAGRRGVLKIPYAAITSIQFGLTHGRPATPGRGSIVMVPWDQLEQFTEKAHYLLTLGYRDQANLEQMVVFEPGRSLVRPALEALARRSGKAISFLSVDACMLFANDRDQCGYGQANELKGLTRVVLDADAAEPRKLILAEIETGNAGLQLVESPDAADIFLVYRRMESANRTAGRGEVSVRSSDRPRVVLIVTGMKNGFLGKDPAITFGQTFVDAVRTANGLK